MATAIQITSCLTQARDRRRFGILTTTFSAPACLGLLFLQAGLSWAWPILMATAIQITSCLTQARDRRRYGIVTITFSAPACLGLLFLQAGLSWAWRTLMAMAIQITSCITQARARRRYGILTTDRKSDVEGKSVDIGGERVCKNKNSE